LNKPYLIKRQIKTPDGRTYTEIVRPRPCGNCGGTEFRVLGRFDGHSLLNKTFEKQECVRCRKVRVVEV